MKKFIQLIDSISQEITPQENKKNGVFISPDLSKEIIQHLKSIDDYSLFGSLIQKIPNQFRQYFLKWIQNKFQECQRVKNDILTLCINKIDFLKDQSIFELLKSSIFYNNLQIISEEISKKYDKNIVQKIISNLKKVLDQDQSCEEKNQFIKYSSTQVQKIIQYFKNYQEYCIDQQTISQLVRHVLLNNFSEFQILLAQFVGENMAKDMEKEVIIFIEGFKTQQPKTQSYLQVKEQKQQMTSYGVFLIKCKKNKKKIQNVNIKISSSSKTSNFVNVHFDTTRFQQYIYTIFIINSELDYMIQLSNQTANTVIKIQGKDYSNTKFNFVIKAWKDEFFNITDQISMFQSIIYLMRLTSFQTILQFTIDLKTTLNINQDERKEIVQKCQEKYLPDLKQLKEHQRKRIEYLSYIFACAYSHLIYTFKNESQSLYIFQYKVIYVNEQYFAQESLSKQFELEQIQVEKLVIKVQYLYDSPQRVSNNLNNFMQKYQSKALDFVLFLLCDDYNVSRQRKINRKIYFWNQKLLNYIVRSQKTQYQKLYYCFICYEYFAFQLFLRKQYLSLVDVFIFVEKIIEDNKNQDYQKKKDFQNVRQLESIIIRVMKQNLIPIKLNQFKTIIKIIERIPNNIMNLLKNQQFQEALSIYVKKFLCQNKSIQSVQMLEFVFLQDRQKQIISKKTFQNYLNEFFFQRQQLTVFGISLGAKFKLVSLEVSVLQEFLNRIFYPLLQKSQNQEQKEKSLKMFIISLHAKMRLEDIFICVNEGLKNIELQKKWVKIQYLQDAFFPEIMKRCRQLSIWNCNSFVYQKIYLKLFSLEPIWKSFLIDYTIQVFKNVNQKDRQLIAQLTNRIVDEKYLEEEEKDHFIYKILNYEDQYFISYQKIRSLLFDKKPNIKFYLRLFKTQKHSTIIQKLQSCLTEIFDQIQKQKISFVELKHIKDLSQQQKDQFDALFRKTNKQFKKLLNTLIKKLNKYYSQIKKARKICQNYNNIIVIQKLTNLIQQTFLKFKSQSVLNYDHSNQLQVLFNLDSNVVKLICYNFVKITIQLDQNLNIEEFCKSIEIIFHQTIQKIKNCVLKFKDNELLLYQILSIIENQAQKDIKSIFTFSQTANEKQLQQIISIKQNLTEIPKLIKIISLLLYFSERYNKISEQDKLREYFDKLKNIKENTCREFLKIVEELKQIFQKYSISQGQTETIIKLSIECQQLFTFVSTLKVQQLEDLQDYLTDEQELSISLKNFQELKIVREFVITVLNDSKSFEEFIEKIILFLDRSKTHDSILSQSPNSCRNMIQNFNQIITEAKNKQNLLKSNIIKVMEKSLLKIYYEKQNDSRRVQMFTNDKKLFDFEALSEWMCKSLMILNNFKKQGNKAESQALVLKKFVQFYQCLNNLLKNYEKLDNLGYFQHFVEKQELKFQICDYNFQQIKIHQNLVDKQCNEQWIKKIEQAQQKSFLICHFQGHELRNLADSIFNRNKIPSVFLKIIEEFSDQKIDSAQYEIFLKKIKYKMDSNPLNHNVNSKLNILKQALLQFVYLPSIQNQILRVKQLDNQKQVPIKLVNISQNQLFSGILAAFQTPQTKINMTQILICKSTTNYYEIKSFLLRAIHNPKSPYFIIGIRRLSFTAQNDFCSIFQSFLSNSSIKKILHNINLYLIDSSTIEKVYNFISNTKKFKLIRAESQSNIAKNYFQKMAGNLNIVCSSDAGLGKTFWIEQKAKEQKLEIKYFPVSGSFTLQRLVERLKKLQLNERSALVIQIHNVKCHRLLDEFLFQIIFYKCIKLKAYYYLPQNLRIFIELQNVLDETHFDKYQTLQLFQGNQRILIRLNKLRLQDIFIDQNDKSTMFVFLILSWFNQKKLNSKQISFQSFRQQYLQQKQLKITVLRCRELLDIYFLSFFRLKNQQVSFVQIRLFVSLLFDSFKQFCNSPFFLIQTTKCIEIGEYRQKYVQILVKNSRQFLDRTITQNNFKQQSKDDIERFNKQLRNFPLLVIPNSDQSTFSFVYKNHKEVDPIIKQFILLQSRSIKTTYLTNQKLIQQSFQKQSFNSLDSEELTQKILQILCMLANSEPDAVIADASYSLTLDNFLKMCLIIQRMRARIPINIMGETGVGKTALIRFLVQNIFKQKLQLFNIHAGITETQLVKYVNIMKQNGKQAKSIGQRLWVFFDEFNTTEELGYIKQIIMDRRFLGQKLGDEFVFICACNPFRKNKQKLVHQSVGIKKNKKQSGKEQLRYQVCPPPLSMIECMWDYQELKDLESKQYINTILFGLQYKPELVSNLIFTTHQMFKKSIQISAVNLRDVSRFKILFKWFLKNMPHKRSENTQQNQQQQINENTRELNYIIPRPQRAFILSLCFCYYMRLESSQKRKQYLRFVERQMNFRQNYVKQILDNQQIDYLSRMKKPEGTALNQALKENVFATFVCILNKLPIIIVGRPGCSKSLAIRLLVPNLKGPSSEDQFFRQLPEVKLFCFQGSQFCRSEGVQNVFQKAILKTTTNKIPLILFDQIGLAELSQHKPLKVLHSYLEINRTQVGFIGLSNWELDASKMSRFLIINRPIPDQESLFVTSKKISENISLSTSKKFVQEIKALSDSYYAFMQQQKQNKNNKTPDFFGLRDFYSLIKYVARKLSTANQDNQNQIESILLKAVQRNFDGKLLSIQNFLHHLKGYLKKYSFRQSDYDIVDLIEQNLADKNDSRCLLQITKGESLVYLFNHLQNQSVKNTIISFHGSTFTKDKDSQEYILSIVSSIINYVSQGNIIILKDMPNSVQTSLYDLLNKNFQRDRNKSYCRIAVGTHFNPRCYVHPDFNCIVFITEDRIKQVDPPFLNRFQKHYLTLDKFIGEDENKLIQAIQSWLGSILKAAQSQQYSLQKQHYIVNICNESISSLAIKLVLNYKQESFDELLKRAKKILLFNSTVDFQLYLTFEKKSINEKQLEFIEQTLEQKQIFIKQKGEGSELLLIYTYDGSVSVLDQNIFCSKSSKTIKMFEIKSEKDLRMNLESFFANDRYQSCQIIFNYESQYEHLCLTQFLIDSISKKHQTTKKIFLVLIVSRLTLLEKGLKRHRQVSYLNGYTQIFIQSLQNNDRKVSQLPDKGVQLYESFNLDDSISELFANAVTRFNFTYPTDEQKVNAGLFNKIIFNLSQNTIFINCCKFFIFLNLQKNNGKQNKKPWKKELLINKQIINMALTTTQAMKLYFSQMLQNLIASFILWIVQNQVIYCFQYDISIEILNTYIKSVSQDFSQIFENQKIKDSYTSFVQTITKYFLSNSFIEFKRVSRVIGEQKCILSFPRLFPFSKKETSYILKELKQVEGNEDNNRAHFKEQNTLQDIYDKLQSLEHRLLFQQQDNQTQVQYISLTRQGLSFINKKSKLKIVNSQNQIVSNFVEIMNTNKEWLKIKQLYLLDIKNSYLTYKQISKSKYLNGILQFFVKEQDTIQQNVYILLRGKQLWSKIMKIYKIFSDINKTYRINLFFDGEKDRLKELDMQQSNFQSEMQFKRKKVRFIEQFMQNCSKYLFPCESNITLFGGIQEYEMIFNNIYYILQVFQNDYKQHRIKIPSNLRLMKNFIKTLEKIAKNKWKQLCVEFIQVQNTNMYHRIHTFLEQIKQSKRFIDKQADILKYQASTLFRSHLEYLKQSQNSQKQEEEKYFIDQFVKLVNTENRFANYSSNVLLIIFKSNLNFEESTTQMIEKLSNKALNTFLTVINSDIQANKYSNNLAIVLTDFFCKHVIKDPDNTQQQNIDSQKHLKEPLQNYIDQFKNLIKLKLENRLNGIQNCVFLAFCRTFLKYYVDCLDGIEANFACDQMLAVDQILSQVNQIASNLRLYCLKLLRKKSRSIKKLKQKYFAYQKAKWLSMTQQYLVQVFGQQFIVPPEIDQFKGIDQLIKRFRQSNYSNMQVLQQMLNLKDKNSKYKVFNLFLTQIYSNICGNESKAIMEQFFGQDNKALQSFELQLLKRYTSSKISDKIFYTSQTDAETLNTHIWFMNNLNWLLSVREKQSPLTSIFFDKQKIPASFSKHIEYQFLICGIQNPYVSIMNNLYDSISKNVGVYICSKQCDFMYTIQNCGWPTQVFICRFCNQTIGGTGHVLSRFSQGARRIGPNLLYKQGVFRKPDDFQIDNTDHSPFYAYNLPKTPVFISCLKSYIQLEIDRVSEAKSIQTLESPYQKLTGFTTYHQGLTRIQPITQNILNLIMNSLLYLFLQMDYISEQQCKYAFQNKSRDEMKDFFFEYVKKQSQKIKKSLNAPSWESWLMGMQKQIFQFSNNMETQVKLGQIEKQNQIKSTVDEIILSIRSSTEQSHKQLFQNILNEDLIFKTSNSKSLTAFECKNRNFFQKSVQKRILQVCQGEEKLQFIKISKNTKGPPSCAFEQILLQQSINQTKQWTFARVLRLAQNPTLEHMKRQYDLTIKTQYPVLDFILNRSQNLETIHHYYNIVSFVNQISKHVDFRVSRQTAKTTKVINFIDNLEIKQNQKKGLIEKLNKFLVSWSHLASKTGEIQFQCKTIGKMNNQYSNQSPLLCFLLDELDKQNYYGKMMIVIFQLFGFEVNQFLQSIEAKKHLIPALKDVQLFSDIHQLPQKLTKNDIINIYQDEYASLIISLSSTSVKYGTGVPLYDFEVIQHNLITKLYGKSYFITDSKQFINIQFSGEAFTRMSKYSNCIIQLRQIGANQALKDIETIKQKFENVKNRNTSLFYNTMKQFQGFIQKLMVSYKNLKDENITIGDYVQKYNFKKIPELILELPFRDIPIECIVSLYEIGEQTINYKIWQILPFKYKQGQIEKSDINKFKDILKLMQKGDKNLPTLEQFKNAFYRFVSRCLILGQISQCSNLNSLLPYRSDFWPNNFPQQKLEIIVEFDLELSKVYSFQKLIKNLNEKYKPEPIIAHAEQKYEVTEKKKRHVKAKVNVQDIY